VDALAPQADSEIRRHTLAGPMLVTGGSSGLGRSVVEALAVAGATPIVLDVREPEDGEVEFEAVDLADARAAEEAVRSAAERHGGLAAVVTAAGIDACGKLEDVEAEAWDRVVRVNLLGTAAVVRGALPYLRESGGKIVTVASTLGLRTLSDASAYCASKFGVVGFTRALMLELAGDVGVTLLVPGGMRTSFFDGREEKYKPPPDMEMNDPANVAAAIVFALAQPRGCEIRELIVTPSVEPSWP
jgi:NAD(P)-dependent dehydrogenase (short-subunit alcohol dehydrogenase family)